MKRQPIETIMTFIGSVQDRTPAISNTKHVRKGEEIDKGLSLFSLWIFLKIKVSTTPYAKPIAIER